MIELFNKINNLNEFPSNKNLKLLSILSMMFAFVILLLMRPIEEELKSLTPYGVMELEFAWTVTQINTIFTHWGDVLIAKELTVTLLDFGFLIFYSTLLFGVTLLLNRNILHPKFIHWGNFFSLIPFLAAFFYVIENLNLILMLSSPFSFPTFAPFLVSACATIKFGLLIGILIFWLTSIILTAFLRKE